MTRDEWKDVKMSLGGNLELDEVKAVERVALHAWPGLEIEENAGWLMRFAKGITRRANSVWPNELYSVDEVEAKVASVEKFYHARGLPARFQICPAALPTHLDELLEQRGYRAVARTAVQTTSLEALSSSLGVPSTLQVEVMAQPSASWWACYAKADDVPLASVAARKSICDAIHATKAYAIVIGNGVIGNGEAIAVGSAAVEAGWIGFFNVATLAEHRRMGAARATLAALVAWGRAQGATQAYLQVMAENTPALRLYARLGFTTGYYYHYREEVRA